MRIALLLALAAWAGPGGAPPSGEATPDSVEAAEAAYQEAVERYNAYGLANHTFADEGARSLAREKEAAWARFMRLGGPKAAARSRRSRPLPPPRPEAGGPLPEAGGPLPEARAPAEGAPAEALLPDEPAPLPPVWPARALLAVGLLATAAAGGLAWPIVSRRVICCSGCRRKLRVPRWRKVRIRCPDCRTECRLG